MKWWKPITPRVTIRFFIKVMTHTIAELHSVLATKIQLIDEIQSTETLISMQNPIYETLNLKCHRNNKGVYLTRLLFFN